MNFTLGTVLQMQATVPDNAPRYSVRLIGAVPGGSLIVATPTVDGKVQLVREGQRFNVRALKGERVMGFVAAVLVSSTKPYPHLHLDFPEDIEQIVVRNGSRVRAAVPAGVRDLGDKRTDAPYTQVVLIDLSESGAKIASDQVLGGVDTLLHVKFMLTISGVDEELGLLGHVRNMHERIESGPEGERTVIHTGVSFRNSSRYQQVLLNAWVTNQELREALRSHAG